MTENETVGDGPRCTETFGTWGLVDARKIIVEGRARKQFSPVAMNELRESIERGGLLHPLVVKQLSDGRYRLVAGERRFRACCMLGWREIPCTVRSSMSDIEAKAAELEENLQREDLEWQEQIELMAQIDEVKRAQHGSSSQGKATSGWSVAKTAQLLGVSVGPVSEKIALAKKLRASPELKEKIKNLPLTAAVKEVKRIEERQRVERLQASGALEVDESLLFGSAPEKLRELDEGSVDLVVTDPPFGIGELEDQRGQKRDGVVSYTAKLKDEDNLTLEAATKLFEETAGELVRVLRPGGMFYVFFAWDAHQAFRDSLTSVGLVVAPVPLIWDKGRTTSAFRGYDYSPCYEPILFGYKPPRTRRLAKAAASILRFSPLHANHKVHPFEKPLSLLKFFIEQSTVAGETVLDPFAGSGSTLVAAKELGRRAIGIEVDREHFGMAQSRLVGGESGKL